jgi:hypothetical protein
VEQNRGPRYESTSYGHLIFDKGAFITAVFTRYGNNLNAHTLNEEK